MRARPPWWLLGFSLVGLFLGGASCERRPSYTEFQARTWRAECSVDADCVLLAIPCDHCGGERAVSASEASAYRSAAAEVDCSDYTLQQEVVCGSPVDTEPACSAGRCTARPVEAPPAPAVETPSICDDLRARAATVLSRPAVGCQTDGDCACYPAFIDCGGVRDAASAATLDAIAADGHAADCGYVDESGSEFNCAPWECVPACEAGTCQRGSR